MNIKFQRAVDRLVGVPICFVLSQIDRLFRRQETIDNPRRILIILLSEMGSLVLAQPMFSHLREKYPLAELHVMLFAKNREILDLLGVVPEANVITLDDRSLLNFIRDSWRAIWRTRSLKLDAVIDCELFSRVSSIFAYLSGARLLVGFHSHTQEGLYRGSFINRPVMYNPYRHLTLQFLTLTAALESSTYPLGKGLLPPAPKNPPYLHFAASELEAVAARLHADFPAVANKPLILVSPSGGILPIRAWPLASYKTLCSELVAAGYAVAIVGLKGDRPIGETLVAHCASEQCINLTGWTRNVRELLALFHRAALLITNDGGPGQFAALTPTPSIVFFGPETPMLYRSLSENAYNFHRPIACSPCLTAYNHRNSPCDGDNQCLKQITPEEVLERARSILGKPGGSL
ncbi:MAG: glycosyltransferase family 9 protein [Betaproteobacteria bacterium]